MFAHSREVATPSPGGIACPVFSSQHWPGASVSNSSPWGHETETKAKAALKGKVDRPTPTPDASLCLLNPGLEPLQCPLPPPTSRRRRLPRGQAAEVSGLHTVFWQR